MHGSSPCLFVSQVFESQVHSRTALVEITAIPQKKEPRSLKSDKQAVQSCRRVGRAASRLLNVDPHHLNLIHPPAETTESVLLHCLYAHKGPAIYPGHERSRPIPLLTAALNTWSILLACCQGRAVFRLDPTPRLDSLDSSHRHLEGHLDAVQTCISFKIE